MVCCALLINDKIENISCKCHGHKSNFLNVNCLKNVLLFVLGGGLHVNILLCELLIVRGS